MSTVVAISKSDLLRFLCNSMCNAPVSKFMLVCVRHSCIACSRVCIHVRNVLLIELLLVHMACIGLITDTTEYFENTLSGIEGSRRRAATL